MRISYNTQWFGLDESFSFQLDDPISTHKHKTESESGSTVVVIGERDVN